MQDTRRALEDKKVRDAMDKVLDRNEEGLQTLKNEELAQERREETVIGRYIRVAKKKLGLRRNESEIIQLS